MNVIGCISHCRYECRQVDIWLLKPGVLALSVSWTSLSTRSVKIEIFLKVSVATSTVILATTSHKEDCHIHLIHANQSRCLDTFCKSFRYFVAVVYFQSITQNAQKRKATGNISDVSPWPCHWSLRPKSKSLVWPCLWYLESFALYSQSHPSRGYYLSPGFARLCLTTTAQAIDSTFHQSV